MALRTVPGGPTSQQSRRFAKPVAGSGVSNKYTTANRPDQARNNEFPVVPFAPDSYDTLASIKQSVGSNHNPAFGDKWMVPFTDNDAQYLLRQQAQVQNANYERWLWKQYDVTNPAEAWIFQQIAPEQFEKRKQLILYQQNLATRYAMLRLYGVKSEEDLMLKYLVETKQVELPRGPVYAPAAWMAAQNGLTEAEYKETEAGLRGWEGRYRAGMFSAMKYGTESGVGKMPGANRADALGWGAENVDSQLFVGSDIAADSADHPYSAYGRGANRWAHDSVYRAGGRGFGRTVIPPPLAGPVIAPMPIADPIAHADIGGEPVEDE